MSEQMMDGPTNVSVGGAKIDGDRMDMDALRELSVSEYDKEFAPTQKLNGKAAAKAKAEEEVEEIEETFEEEETDSPEQESTEEAPEEEADEEQDDEAEEPEEADGAPEKSFLTAKTKDGKKVKIAKDAVIEVKIDGKTEEMTVQEVINNAAGAVDLGRKHSELGRERKKLAIQQQEFEKHIEVTNDNLAMLQHIATHGTPEDFAQYYGSLTGQDPAEVIQGIVQRAIEYAEQFSRLSPRERELYNENRKFKFQQELAKREQDRTAKQQTFQKERAEVETALKDHGLSMQDFLAACEDVKQRIADGELRGTFTAMDIVAYAATLGHEKKVSAAVSVVNKSLLNDSAFVANVSKAIAAAEAQSGEKFTAADTQRFVKLAMEKRKNGVRESLSKKVQRHQKSGKTNSQNAHSRKQEKNTGGALTLQEHRERLWGGD